MFVVIWEFRAEPRRVAAFEAAYSTSGPWVRLFERDVEFVGSELVRDAADPLRYVTIDRWSSADAYDRFRAAFAAEYAEIDAACEALTAAETPIGRFNVA